jgi:c-di-GMP-related signal transduction protein
MTKTSASLLMSVGCDLFQGYFFAKPIILTGRSMQPSAVARRLYGRHAQPG